MPDAGYAAGAENHFRLMGQKEDTLFNKARNALRVRLSLILVVVAAIVLEGAGLMQYFYNKREDSDPRAGMIFVALLLIGLVLVVLIMIRAVRNMRQLGQVTSVKERMEKELEIAKGIQMSMIPKIFPPFPERSDIDIFASIVPAKEVGGDLYDFYIRDGRLYFCIGDVSGKGVPASLVMAVTRSLFRTVSGHEKSPAKIVTSMNDSMSDMNESSMFVTFFCGTLDLETGHLRYCNAGHNAPEMLRRGSGCEALPVEANLPLGIMSRMPFKEQETDLVCGDSIFLYTDGVTEAENPAHEQFGHSRMTEALAVPGDSRSRLTALSGAVEAFVDGALPSDDITMLYISYQNAVKPDMEERHLILHNDIRQIPQLAGFVETIAEEKKIDKSLAMSLNLALEEAVSNVIMYAYPEGSDGLVDIEAILRPSSIEFIVSDSGNPFDPTSAPEPDTTLGVEDRPVGGLGVFMVKSIMDSVSYERQEGKNVLKMIKQL